MSLLPGPWIGFSLAYSRAEPRSILQRWRVPIGIAMFIVGFLFWATPLHYLGYSRANDAQNAAVQLSLAQNLPHTGRYTVPNPASQVGANGYSKGPIATIDFPRPGDPPWKILIRFPIGGGESGYIAVKPDNPDLVFAGPDWSLKLEGPVEEVYTGTLSSEFAEAWLVQGTLLAQDNALAPAEAALKRYVELAQTQRTAEERSRSFDLRSVPFAHPIGLLPEPYA